MLFAQILLGQAPRYRWPWVALFLSFLPAAGCIVVLKPIRAEETWSYIVS